MHFVITFGFLIPTKSYKNVENENSTESKKKVTKKQRLKKEATIKNITNITEVASNIVNTGEILTETHVEYELLPGYTFKFDCRCWRTATKIYTENGDWCLRPISCPAQENNLWVIFSVHHEVHLSETELRILFNHVITYQIFPGRGKFSERAKKDNVKQLYTDPEAINIQSNDFLELYPSRWKDNTRSKPEPTIVKHETNEFSITSYLDVIPDSRHQHKFWKMIKKDRFPSESLIIELAPSTEVPLKTKKLKNTKTQEIIVQKMSVTAGNLFSDMGIITCWTGMSLIPSIPSSFIYTQCDNILFNKKLRRILNNISIKLEQMSNFPDDIVIRNGFNYLYVKADFIDRTIITPYYAPTKTIYFEFMQSFMNEEFQAEELISFLGTKLLTFQVIGVRSRNTVKSLISIPKTQSKESFTLEKEAVLLGFASFDLSDLLRGLWEVRLIGSLCQPSNMNDCSNEDSLDNSPFTHDILTMFGTVIKIKVRSAHDLRMIHHVVLERIRSFNRIFLILEDYPLADSILADVFSHNCTLFSNIQNSEDNDLKIQVEETSKDILTGFAIDFCNRYYIFLEGLAKGYLLKVWERVAKLESKSVFYNSSDVFLVRLYKDFICIGGVLKLKTSEPLEVQLQQHSVYIGKTRTTHQAHLIRTVGLMKLTSTMTALAQTCLFPKASAVKAILEDVEKHFL